MTTRTSTKHTDPERSEDPVPRGPSQKGSSIDAQDGAKPSLGRTIGKWAAIVFIALVGVLLILSLISPGIAPNS